jgi:hypothetical protein
MKTIKKKHIQKRKQKTNKNNEKEAVTKILIISKVCFK